MNELAARYAGGLFELAEEQTALDQVAEDLRRLKQDLASSAEMRLLLMSPTLSRDEQGTAMAALLDQAGASALTRNFVALVARNRRLYMLGSMIDAFLAELARRRGEVTAQVRAAQPLSEAQLAAVTDALKASFGAKLNIEVQVDAELLGGLVVKVGSQMVDSSLRTKIDKLQQAMKAPGGPF